MLLLAAPQSWAHGNLFEQASGVTAACLEVMQKNEPKKLIRLFQSLDTTMTGIEVFTVTVRLKDGTELHYTAVGVDDELGGFSWNCAKN